MWIFILQGPSRSHHAPFRPTHPHHQPSGLHGPVDPSQAHSQSLLVSAVKGASGERLELLQPVDVGSGRPLEVWMQELEKATKAGSAAATKACMASCGVMQVRGL